VAVQAANNLLWRKRFHAGLRKLRIIPCRGLYGQLFAKEIRYRLSDQFFPVFAKFILKNPVSFERSIFPGFPKK
jgi:hypothetical protein